MDDRMWFLKPFIEAAKMAEAIDLVGNKANETLKKCPCCNGAAHHVVEERPDPPFHFRVRFVECMSCGLRTKEYPSDGFYGVCVTEEQIAALWNRRANDHENA